MTRAGPPLLKSKCCLIFLALGSSAHRVNGWMGYTSYLSDGVKLKLKGRQYKVHTDKQVGRWLSYTLMVVKLIQEFWEEICLSYLNT